MKVKREVYRNNIVLETFKDISAAVIIAMLFLLSPIIYIIDLSIEKIFQEKSR